MWIHQQLLEAVNPKSTGATNILNKSVIFSAWIIVFSQKRGFVDLHLVSCELLNSSWHLVGENEGGEVSITLKPTVSVMGMYCNIKMLSWSWETECLFQSSLSLEEFYPILKCKSAAGNHDLAINNSIILLIWWHLLGRRLLLFLTLKQICSLRLKEVKNPPCAEAVGKGCRELSQHPAVWLH